MKKLFAVIVTFSVLMIGTSAIAGTIDTAKMSKSAKKAKVAADKAKATTDKAKDKAKETTDKAVDKSKATADAAKDKAKTTADQAADKTKTASDKAKKTVTDVPNKSADKAIGKDASGRTVYLGPKGGQYVLSASGKKEYLSKDKKIAVK
ncbi:MAG TPA: hypothetical protein VIM89_14440 [Mucilaginibacter sp.]